MLTKQEVTKLCRFLQCAGGNWRNAVYIECRSCPHSLPACAGYLLTADSEGKPVLYPARLLREITGEEIIKDECSGILTREAFYSLYAMRLIWDTDSDKQCGLRQMFFKSSKPI
ncbi:hypothetical protein [Solibaculum mannosilyticum]|uniref:hypothetical protein n=1 Tax=Solibaculum mannosilyticum TaxID=2780922 RepID=UPI0007A8FDF8|nr:hypothetical protein BN3661_00938 [Eubacteriaceae bacterium CHKCI005]